MPSLIAYRKVIDAVYTHDLRLEGAQELATLADGRTVVCVPDASAIGEQPEAIIDSIEELPSPLPAELREEICKTSPHVRLINARVVEKIRAEYSLEDEIKLLRTAPSDEAVRWNEFVESCVAWGCDEKARLGL
jgi:hypothetical protein